MEDTIGWSSLFQAPCYWTWALWHAPFSFLPNIFCLPCYWPTL